MYYMYVLYIVEYGRSITYRGHWRYPSAILPSHQNHHDAQRREINPSHSRALCR